MAVMMFVFDTIFSSSPFICVTDPVKLSLFLFTYPVTTTSCMVCESSSRNIFRFFSAFSFEDMVCVSIPIYDTLISKFPLGTFILNFPSMSADVPVSSLPFTYMAMLAPGRISPVAFSYTAPSTVTTSLA